MQKKMFFPHLLTILRKLNFKYNENDLKSLVNYLEKNFSKNVIIEF